jgi:hypothetical protein
MQPPCHNAIAYSDSTWLCIIKSYIAIEAPESPSKRISD